MNAFKTIALFPLLEIGILSTFRFFKEFHQENAVAGVGQEKVISFPLNERFESYYRATRALER